MTLAYLIIGVIILALILVILAKIGIWGILGLAVAFLIAQGQLKLS